MKNRYLAGLGLGAIAAIVFASATTGPLIARFLLFFITPLPIALAGLGWGLHVGTLAGITGTALVAIWAGPLVAAAFAMSQVLPVIGLTYLALLSRPLAAAPTTDAPAVSEPPREWYPPGRMIIWAAAMAGALSITSLLLLGGDLETLRRALEEIITSAVKDGLPAMPGGGPLGESEIKSLSEVALGVLPAASAMSWMASLLFNLWLAGRVTLASGQLPRPWPDLAAIEFPRGTALAFGAALIATTLSGYPGLAASGFAGALFVTFVLLGLAVVHYATRGRPWRSFALWAVYAALMFVNIWAAVLIALVGLSEPIVRLRARTVPPPDSSNP